MRAEANDIAPEGGELRKGVLAEHGIVPCDDRQVRRNGETTFHRHAETRDRHHVVVIDDGRRAIGFVKERPRRDPAGLGKVVSPGDGGTQSEPLGLIEECNLADRGMREATEARDLGDAPMAETGQVSHGFAHGSVVVGRDACEAIGDARIPDNDRR